MKNQSRRMKFLSIIVYLLAGVLFLISPMPASKSVAAVITENISGTVMVGVTEHFSVPRYMTMSESLGNGAGVRLTGWSSTSDLKTISMGMRNSSGTQFARWETNQPLNYSTTHAFLKPNGNGNLPKGVFYLNAKVTSSSGLWGAFKTFYAQLKYTVQ